jgi:hypothetical protein
VSLGTILTIGAGLLALIWGVWLGLPGRYTQTADEIEKVMEQGGGRPRPAKRVFTPLAWMMRKTTTTPRRHRRFKLESPKDR